MILRKGAPERVPRAGSGTVKNQHLLPRVGGAGSGLCTVGKNRKHTGRYRFLPPLAFQVFSGTFLSTAWKAGGIYLGKVKTWLQVSQGIRE